MLNKLIESTCRVIKRINLLVKNIFLIMLIFKRRREENAALYHAEVSKDDVKAFDGPTGLDVCNFYAFYC